MREKDLHKKIRESGAKEGNDALYSALSKMHPEISRAETADKEKHKRKFTALFWAVFAPVAAVVSAAVLVPTLLLTGNTQDDLVGSNQSGAKSEYKVSMLDCTVIEYNERNGTSLLYFDFAELSDYALTEYVHVETEAFCGISVRFVNPETNDDIEYTVCPTTEPLDFLKYNISVCKREQTVSERSVKWGASGVNCYGIFEHDGYEYYLTLKNNRDETRLFELAEMLLGDR
ncbi:MAG: hypothetical protein J1G38_07270 [Clostridiales bacterium]|nr:hypothetical protein [Clostridiales bacterium]